MTKSGQICKMSHTAYCNTYCNMGQLYCNILQYAFCRIVLPSQCTYPCFPGVLFKPVPCTLFFPSHWLLSHITIIETMDSRERGMNPVAMTIIIPHFKVVDSWDCVVQLTHYQTTHFRLFQSERVCRRQFQI